MKEFKHSAFRRVLALLLCFCMVAGYVPVPSHAEAMDPHHPVHTDACGYREAVPASPCTHVHGEECYTTAASCVHTHSGACYSDPALLEQGAAPDACTHVHDAACGYSEGSPASPCTFVCSESHEEPTEVPTEAPTEAPTEVPMEEATAKSSPRKQPQLAKKSSHKSSYFWRRYR